MRRVKTYRILFVFISLLFASEGYTQVAASISLWKDSVIGAIWNPATQTVAYGRADTNGYFKIYLSDSLGNNETPLTYAGWQNDRHQWAEEWDPSGQYLICYVEKAAYVIEWDHLRIPEDAIPGYGAYTDIWLLKRDGSQAWQLTNFPNDYSNGVIHGAISPDGTKFTWSERTVAPDIWTPIVAAGGYVFRVADLTYPPNAGLSNIQTYQPGNIDASGEVESFSPDMTKIAVYSTFETQNLVNTPIYNIDLATGQTTKMSTESFAQCPTYTPDGLRMVYMTGKDCDIFPWQLQGADWWIMNADSTNKTRLTYMNVTGHPQCVNQYRLGGSISYMSGTSFLGGVMTQSLGLFGYTAKVDFSNIVGVNEQAVHPLEFLTYPNPVSDMLTIRIVSGVNQFAVRITDINGRVVLTGTNQTQFDMTPYAPGSYFVEVTDRNGNAAHKLFMKN